MYEELEKYVNNLESKITKCKESIETICKIIDFYEKQGSIKKVKEYQKDLNDLEVTLVDYICVKVDLQRILDDIKN